MSNQEECSDTAQFSSKRWLGRLISKRKGLKSTTGMNEGWCLDDVSVEITRIPLKKIIFHHM